MRAYNGGMGNYKEDQKSFPEEQKTELGADGERLTRQRNRMGERAFGTEATACAEDLRWEKSQQT